MSPDALPLRIEDLEVESFLIEPSIGPSYQMDGTYDETCTVKITLQTIVKSTCVGATCGMYACATE